MKSQSLIEMISSAEHLSTEMADDLGRYLRFVEESPQSPVAHNNMGFAWGNRGELDKAVLSFSKAIELDPQLYVAHANLAIIFERQGRRGEAMKHYEIAANLGYSGAAEKLAKLKAEEMKRATPPPKPQPEPAKKSIWKEHVVPALFAASIVVPLMGTAMYFGNKKRDEMIAAETQKLDAARDNVQRSMETLGQITHNPNKMSAPTKFYNDLLRDCERTLGKEKSSALLEDAVKKHEKYVEIVTSQNKERSTNTKECLAKLLAAKKINSWSRCNNFKEDVPKKIICRTDDYIVNISDANPVCLRTWESYSGPFYIKQDSGTMLVKLSNQKKEGLEQEIEAILRLNGAYNTSGESKEEQEKKLEAMREYLHNFNNPDHQPRDSLGQDAAFGIMRAIIKKGKEIELEHAMKLVEKRANVSFKDVEAGLSADFEKYLDCLIAKGYINDREVSFVREFSKSSDGTRYELVSNKFYSSQTPHHWTMGYGIHFDSLQRILEGMNISFKPIICPGPKGSSYRKKFGALEPENARLVESFLDGFLNQKLISGWSEEADFQIEERPSGLDKAVRVDYVAELPNGKLLCMKFRASFEEELPEYKNFNLLQFKDTESINLVKATIESKLKDSGALK